MKIRFCLGIVMITATALLGVSGCSRDSEDVAAGQQKLLGEVKRSNDLAEETNQLLSQLIQRNQEVIDSNDDAQKIVEQLVLLNGRAEQLAGLTERVEQVALSVVPNQEAADFLRQINEVTEESGKRLFALDKAVQEVVTLLAEVNKNAERIIAFSQGVEGHLKQVNDGVHLVLSQVDNTKNTISVKEHLEDVKGLLQDLRIELSKQNELLMRK